MIESTSHEIAPAQMGRSVEGNLDVLLRDTLTGPPAPLLELSFEKSMACLERARRLIPAATQTLSKGYSQFVCGGSPLFLERGKGAWVWDVDGQSYLDFTMALAPVILGYADPDVDQAVRRQMKNGVVLSQPHPLEAEIAEEILLRRPGADQVRFAKSGSDVNSAAVRLARAFTGRDLILTSGYHGWHDWTIGTTIRADGVPQAVRNLTLPFEYGRLDQVDMLFRQHPLKIAAVILEPVPLEQPPGGFLENLADRCRGEGALLIFDEVVSGFRLHAGGASGLTGITPDLACLGKAMANGYPLSALAGRGEIMRLLEKNVFFSQTHGGETLSLAACRATLAKMDRRSVHAHIWANGTLLLEGFNALAELTGCHGSIRARGLGPRFVVEFKRPSGEVWWELKSLFQQECVRRGLLFTGSHNLAYAHARKEIQFALRVYAGVLRAVSEALAENSVSSLLEGPPIAPIL